MRLGAVGDAWVFRQVYKDQPWHRTEFDIALRKAEQEAEVDPLPGALAPVPAEVGHRAEELPLSDVIAAGGCKDMQTLLTCYQQADEETMLRVTLSLRVAPPGVDQGLS